MRDAPSESRIAQEIAALEKMKPTLLPHSKFGDDHHEAIEAQLEVLRNRWDEDDDVDENYGDAEDNVRDAAKDAMEWLKGEGETETITETWESLVRK
jgi:hypothetical protein